MRLGLLAFAAVLAAACERGSAPADAPLDLQATAAPACPPHATCWTFPDDAQGWSVAPASGGAPAPVRLTSPPLRARGRTVLAVRLRSTVDLRVSWMPSDGALRALSQWKRPQPWWVDRWNAALLPEGETGRVVIESAGPPPAGESGPTIVASAAELLRDGRGRCHRDHWMGIGPPVTVRDAVVCIPPAEATMTVPADVEAVRLVAANGPEGGRARVALRTPDAPGVALEPVEPLAWQDARADLPASSGDRSLRIATEPLAGTGTVAFAVEPIVGGARAARPNVLVYLVDTLRADALDLSAPEASRTPHVAALAARGTTFTGAIAPAPWTLPTVVSLFTGLDVPRHGIVAGQEMLRPDLVTLATRFRDAGYRTAAFSTNPYVSTRHGMHRGFEAFARVFAPSGPFGVENGLTSSLVADFAVPWIRTHAAEPFFLYLHVMDPHQPYTPRQPVAELASAVGLPPDDPRWGLVRFPSRGRSPHAWGELDRMPREQARGIVAASRTLYDATVAGCDAQFGRVWQALSEAGLADDTLVVFTADHGEEFLEHGLTGHGHALYTEQVHVPLVLAHPTRVPAGRRVDTPVSLAELPEALLHLTGVEQDGTGGRVANLLDPQSATAEAERDVISVLYAPGSAQKVLVSESIVTPRWKLIRNHKLAGGILDEAPPRWQLFDRVADPAEQHDVAAEHPDTVAALSARLAAHTAEGPAATREAERLDQATRDRLRALGYAVD